MSYLGDPTPYYSIQYVGNTTASSTAGGVYHYMTPDGRFVPGGYLLYNSLPAPVPITVPAVIPNGYVAYGHYPGISKPKEEPKDSEELSEIQQAMIRSSVRIFIRQISDMLATSMPQYSMLFSNKHFLSMMAMTFKPIFCAFGIDDQGKIMREVFATIKRDFIANIAEDGLSAIESLIRSVIESAPQMEIKEEVINSSSLKEAL